MSLGLRERKSGELQGGLAQLVRSTSLPEVVDDFCFDSLRRLLAAAYSRVEQADGYSATTARFRREQKP